jgi:hypothetical protein
MTAKFWLTLNGEDSPTSHGPGTDGLVVCWTCSSLESNNQDEYRLCLRRDMQVMALCSRVTAPQSQLVDG